MNYTPAQWDALCDLRKVYCSMTWLSPQEQLNIRIGVSCDMRRHASLVALNDLRQDMRRRFNNIEAESLERFATIRQTFIDNGGAPCHTATIESPIIGVQALPGARGKPA